MHGCILICFVLLLQNVISGKDESGWSMYIDKQRSWFMHCRNHEQRCDGGIKVGSTVGVLLDLNKHQLSFFVNDEPQVWRHCCALKWTTDSKAAIKLNQGQFFCF